MLIYFIVLESFSCVHHIFLPIVKCFNSFNFSVDCHSKTTACHIIDGKNIHVPADTLAHLWPACPKLLLILSYDPPFLSDRNKHRITVTRPCAWTRLFYVHYSPPRQVFISVVLRSTIFEIWPPMYWVAHKMTLSIKRSIVTYTKHLPQRPNL